jgi:hypothetical protein
MESIKSHYHNCFLKMIFNPQLFILNRVTHELMSSCTCCYAEAPSPSNMSSRKPFPLRWLTSPHHSRVHCLVMPDTQKTFSEMLGICLRMELLGGSVCQQSSNMATPWETTTTRSPVNVVTALGESKHLQSSELVVSSEM